MRTGNINFVVLELRRFVSLILLSPSSPFVCALVLY